MYSLHIGHTSDSIQHFSITITVAPGDAILLGFGDVVVISQIIMWVVNVRGIDAIRALDDLMQSSTLKTPTYSARHMTTLVPRVTS